MQVSRLIKKTNRRRKVLRFAGIVGEILNLSGNRNILSLSSVSVFLRR
ncbi:hypothetical protein LEP1GSC187_4047 [Leptospira santarosai str. ZUN179]|uniref:Uncharacterized protein n=2 Tax=Leptospira santarosai TaxID=28183 RepID=M6UFM9_9LEPT|nr:hypothetical protein LSS_14662 [Leptospira santarosai serovar Shermani str. LT 821]EMO43365.1 hypothetical protein LEP1GSC187_4047 [Leptospira santarosai str. ZUN179]